MNNFSNEPVLRYFEKVCGIPRCSGDEKAISDYLVNFAKERNLEVIQDSALNVIIKKAGTSGYENAPPVIIQGHMDMVCEKNKATEHDFKKDPIRLRVEGDMLYATDTTLGADNGIAVAYALELLSSEDIPHPPLEVLMTTSEETGMDGAINVDPANLKGKYLVNLDTESEGKFYVSCAGGVRVKHSLPVIWEDASVNLIPYSISLKGLKGGHSGADIHLGRGNSNKLMGRVLHDISSDMEICISEIKGGMRANVIPRETDAIILVKPEDEGKLKARAAEWNNTFQRELRASDPGVEVKLEKYNNHVKKVFSKDTMRKAAASLVMIPNGVQTMSMDIEGLVESSTNLGVVNTSENDITFESSIRSSVKSLKYYILFQLKTAAELIGTEFSSYSDYPEWEYNPKSDLRDLFIRVYKEKYDKAPELVAIHAGLECGLFKSKMPDLDMIALSPDLYDAHTPNEHISISSVLRVWEFLQDVLKEMK